MSFARSTLLTSPVILGIALVVGGAGGPLSPPNTPLQTSLASPRMPAEGPPSTPEPPRPVAEADPSPDDSLVGLASLRGSPATPVTSAGATSGPIPPPSATLTPPTDPADLLFYVNRWRSIPADFPLSTYSPWTPCLGALPRHLAPRARDLRCLPRRSTIRGEEALRQVAWDAPAPQGKTHDGLPVGFEGRVGFGPMLEAALREGHEIKIRSGFRPHVSQATIFRSWVRQQRSLGFAQDEAERRAAASSAHAGHSEHQLGTTADLVYREPRGTFYEGWDPQRIAASAPMRWVHDNARRFGLVISYDRGSSDITQYVWEPWHLRFVGVAVADELHRRGMPLEAWMQERYGAEPPPPYTLPARGEEP
jgi:hypothetical protein